MLDNENEKIDWAVRVFRPILKDLRIPNLIEENYSYGFVKGASYPSLIRENMANCILIVLKYDFANPDNTGLFIWRYKENKNSYILYILLNKKLFENGNSSVFRKAISTHEFLHCIAAMLTFSRLQTISLIRNLQKKMSKRFHYIKNSDGINILNNLRISFKDKTAELEYKRFDDEHFRTGDEDFIASYSDLYKNLLLSYDLFCEEGFFDTDKKEEFFKHKKNNNQNAMLNILKEVTIALSEKKALDKTFIINRIEEFYPKIETDFKKYDSKKGRG